MSLGTLRIWQVGFLLTALVTWATWPFATVVGTSVSDFGDPLLTSWILAWNAHTLIANPSGLIDANIFYPAHATLAYSELLLLPSLVVAPILWLDGDPILANNLLVFGGYVLSGLATFVLVRRLTSTDGAALVSAVIFTLYPYRAETFAKMQLTLTFFWPIVLLALHDVLTSPRRRSIAVAALAMGAQCYTSLYLGVFGGIVFAVVALVLLVTLKAWKHFGRLIAVGLLTLVFVTPLVFPYRSASAVVGERSLEEVQHWSAVPSDYLRAHPESWLYGDDRHLGNVERRLFPGFAAPSPAFAAFIPPTAPSVLAYLAGAVISVDLSLGLNSPGYEWAFRHASFLRALRVPARFGLVSGLMIAVLAGFGVARLLRGRSKATQVVIVSAGIIAVAAEGAMKTQEFSTLADHTPAIYGWLAQQPDGVVCEYPVGALEGRVGPQDATYMYYSTRHWKSLVNGYSGFAPPTYASLIDELRGFPDDRAIDALKTRNVSYLLVHEPFYIEGDYLQDVADLRRRSDLSWVGRFRWKSGQSSDAFLIRR